MLLIPPKGKKFWSPSLIIPSGGLGTVAGLTYQAFATEAVGTSTSTFSSVNFGTASANRVIAVIAVARATAAIPTISSMTIGGVSATLAPSTGVSLDVFRLEIWYASVPSGTSGTVVVNWTQANLRSGIHVYAVVTATPAPSSGVTNSGLGVTSANASITVPSSGFGIVGAIHRQTGNTQSMTNATVDGDTQLAGSNHQFFCGHTSGSGSISVTCTSTPTGNSELISLASWSP